MSVERLPEYNLKRYAIRNSWQGSALSCALYKPFIDEYQLSLIGFFLIQDNWDEKALIDLKHKTEVQLLLGLRTTEENIDKFDVIDGIIICQLTEIQDVMGTFKSVFERMHSVGINIENFWSEKYAHFIQASTKGGTGSAPTNRAVNHIMSQTPKNLSVNSMMFAFESDHELSFEEFKIIEATVEDNVAIGAELFWGTVLIDRPEYCWVGALYTVD